MDEELLNNLSQILSEKNIDINQIIENFQKNSSNEGQPNENTSSQFDPETILKLQKLTMLLKQNGNSKDEALLKALKPYMRDSRKEKIDQYIKLLHILNLLENFQELGGNINE